MASFIGTKREFRRYIGPRLRNLVQQITKNHRVTQANCQQCGSSEYLEAAHVTGRDRNQIIDLVLEHFTHNEIVTIDLGEFEKSFKAEHEPLENTILILCRTCHFQYDSQHKQREARKPIVPMLENQSSPEGMRRTGVLPMSLVPSDEGEFKQQFLQSRLAEIITTYFDGRVERRIWNLLNFRASSSVMRNLRSRPEFRSGEWQARGIAGVVVRVLDNA